ncbi:BTB/POZ K+ channel tetramerization domain containing protein [Babesia bovis T2Bo]|uniref:K+ channel tetramerisation domain containing protein n=1 Tax=Babesia bovis TaxID=5865 RepID=A7ATY4_BABBO|nr:BTB/POZ K+ channel tetramerization domain containing protein [Babesia bovis T2Bo]EDO06395.1 BTB/POZ K+ channel tetramerization domain containing protein [Babesia bovis T2Bo]BAN66231.1 K+ channel tetramerisation domain containing protein [Babesia bovis]|eukprot:XP_001609963.1 K+ channel tetramerisation domain containing protein [Babesia bovis T2Bo]
MMFTTKKHCVDGGQWPYSDPGKRQVDTPSESLVGIVNLNVGGVSYTTTYSTLIKYENSRLSLYFRQLHAYLTQSTPIADVDASFAYVTNDKNSPYPTVFIDRDGRRFGYILDYLRDGEVALPADITLCRQLLQDARFFKLPGLESLISSIMEGKNTYSQTQVMTPPRNAVLSSTDLMTLDPIHPMMDDSCQVITPSRDGYAGKKMLSSDVSFGAVNTYEENNNMFHSQQSYDEETFSSQKSYLQIDENDNIEDAGLFIQTTQISQMGNKEFSTSMDF